ncbi:ras converting CAAX endopeptidase Sras isoform X2 [Leptinotarsa decemlineata]
MLFISPCFLYIGLDNETLEKISFLEILGIKSQGLWRAIFLPLFLTMTLFLGPISMEIWSGVSKIFKGNKEGKCCFPDVTNLIWIRNHVVAPISEEFTYRSCMLPILMQHFSASTAIFSCPLFFGVAHFHHFWERRNHMGMSFKSALIISCFQFTYTTLFGMYSAFIFYRTGHFVSVVAVHAFCNHMGFPEIREIGTYKPGKMMIIISLFFIGFGMWCYLLRPLTEPSLFQNELYL